METNSDIIEIIDNSTIQHGVFNNRIYLMKYNSKDSMALIDKLENIASKNSYEKIFTKIPDVVYEDFIEREYEKEAEIPDYFGDRSCVFMSKFLNESRKSMDNADLIKEIIDQAVERKPKQPVEPPKEFEVGVCSPEDTCEMALLYKDVFGTYPFPIYDPNYLLETMKDNVRYYYVKNEKNEIIALSSAEMDFTSMSAEMTDFATNPDYRGKGLASMLLAIMDKDLIKDRFRTCYTIARAVSKGMNFTFANNGYTFAGSLINNTQISRNFETMNVWYKSIT